MKKLLVSLFALSILFIGSQVNASDFNTTPTSDLTPRISYWYGKVNQHVSVSEGMWQTDSDGVSGANIDKLTYCKKWYPNTTSVVEYKNEIINSWHDAGNVNDYPSTKISYKCVEGNIVTDLPAGCTSTLRYSPTSGVLCGSQNVIPVVTCSVGQNFNSTTGQLCSEIPSITILSPNGGEVYQVGQQITVKWISSNYPSSSLVLIGLSSSLVNEKQEVSTTANDGQETITIPTSAFQGESPLSPGNYYKIGIALGGNPNLSDYSDNLFTINSSTDDGCSNSEVYSSTTGQACDTTTQPVSEKILFLGGYNEFPSHAYFNDVYSSSDMINWNLISLNDKQTNSKWKQRVNESALYFNNKYWIIGGNGTDPDNVYTATYLSDVWSSPDGINWKLVTTTPPFKNYMSYEATVFKGRMYVIGGIDNNKEQTANVWSSSDGVNWKTETTNAAFGVRELVSLATFNGKLLVIGGQDFNNFKFIPDIWSSLDGVSWTKISSNLPISNDGGFSDSVVYKNKIFVLNGNSGTSSLWSSSDGINWTLANDSLPYNSTGSFIVANGKLWISNGEVTATHGQNYLMSSADGISWTRYLNPLPWSPRAMYKIISSETDYSSNGNSYNNDNQIIYPSTNNSLPAGCNSTQGYSTSTGAPCNGTGTTTIVGCEPGYNFSPITGQVCTKSYGVAATNNHVTSTLSSVTPAINTSTITTPTTRTLKVGVTGDDVKALQKFLKITADGKYGNWTATNLKNWQKANGLYPDGSFGPMSRQKAGFN